MYIGQFLGGSHITLFLFHFSCYTLMISLALENNGECFSLLEHFAVASADFMLCSVTNARPIHICETCVGAYNAVIEGHNSLLEMGESPNTTCKEKLINLDRLEIIEAGFSYVKNLWSRGRCQSCFIQDPNITLPFELSNSTKEFQRLYSDTQQCFSHFYNSTENTYNKTVCTNCTKFYCSMNEFYNSLKTVLGDDNICMDVVDTMNMTQNLWSDILHCGETGRTPEVPLIISCSIFLVLPLIFYITVWIFTQSKPSTLSRQKRLSQRLTQRWRSRTGSMMSQFRF